ncbi:DNA repair protein RAD51 homolog 3 [Homalodisca vitripennis]|uniref:DNA repair protein RAD51 homolog 3 n=1 Tax=Homalodisca vitripennis TaxID=197043 RepID=UPI001EEBD238|nr:DNA repair protein RAD51 homolog 3 [Homalodisca vitripennis]XP_046670224.1 DNA repair protein RAD51 homolog 3 [Homalodisca vitripennis]XP_046670225.1 DNA repair protein RAD51 homolog 3 [Homalodisca vitripennis]
MLPVCCLKLPGGIRKKLQDSGFVFAEDLFSTNNELQKEVEKILKSNSDLRTVLKECLNPPHKLSAGDLLKKEETCQRILTFSYRLDRLLGGGLPVGCVTEVCGPPGSGKTQFCLQMCISVQLHTSLGGLQAEAVFIDTDAGFSPQRLTDIGQGCKEHCCRVARSANFSHDLMKTLEEQRFIGYHYIAVQDYSQLLAVVVGLEEFIQKHTQVKIIVIDSLAFPFLQLSDMLKRTVLLCKILQISNRLALNYNLSVVVTNHLTTRISPGENQLIPALGESLGHLMTHRLMFGFLPNDGYFAAVNFKSPSFQNDSAEFQITKDGIRDVH